MSHIQREAAFGIFGNRSNKMNTEVKMSHVMRKQTFCLCENKGSDQLCSNRNCEADQRLFATRLVQFLYFLNPNFGGLRGRVVKVADFSALDHSIISPMRVRASHGARVHM